MEKTKILEQIYNEYYSKLYGYIYSFVKSREDTEDILSNTFLKAFDNIDKFQGDNYAPWLFTIARNTIFDHFKSSNVKKTVVSEELVDKLGISNLEMDITKKDQYEEVITLMEKLSTDQKEMIVLRYIDEMEFAEIAHVVDKNEATVRKTISRGLQRLRAEVGTDRSKLTMLIPFNIVASDGHSWNMLTSAVGGTALAASHTTVTSGVVALTTGKIVAIASTAVVTASLVAAGVVSVINSTPASSNNDSTTQSTTTPSPTVQNTTSTVTPTTPVVTTTADPYATWSTYTNDKYGYSFKYPKEIGVVDHTDPPFVKDTIKSKESVAVASLNRAKTLPTEGPSDNVDGIYLNISVVTEELLSTYEKFKEGLNEGDGYKFQLSKRKISLGNFETTEYTLVNTVGGYNPGVANVSMIFRHNGKIIQISFSEVDPSLNKNLRYEMLKTFRLSDPTLNWLTYTNDKYGYSFKYPKELAVVDRIGPPFTKDALQSKEYMQVATLSRAKTLPTEGPGDNMDGLYLYITKTTEEQFASFENLKEGIMTGDGFKMQVAKRKIMLGKVEGIEYTLTNIEGGSEINIPRIVVLYRYKGIPFQIVNQNFNADRTIQADIIRTFTVTP